MKVLAICACYPTLLQSWFINYLESLQKANITYSVMSLNTGDYPYNKRIDNLRNTSFLTVREDYSNRVRRVFSANINPFSIIRYVRCCFKYNTNFLDALKALEIYTIYKKVSTPSIIHCHSEIAAYRLLPLLKFYNVPIVLTFHGLPPEGVDALTRKNRELLYNSIDRLVVNTEFASRQCQSLYKHKVETSIIPQGIKIEDFPLKKPRKRTTFIALTVGRLDVSKGHMYAIEAVEILKSRGILIEYWIVGTGLYEEELKRHVFQLNLSSCVKFFGAITGDDLLSLYHNAHFLLVPSFTKGNGWAETQGIVIQEAQASGTLVVCSDTGGIPECVIDNHDAFLVKPKSAKAIAEKVTYLIENRSKWTKWKDQSRETVEQNFSLEKMGESLSKLYKELDSSL